MQKEILYVYAIGESLGAHLPRDVEGVDGSRQFTVVSEAGLEALCSTVDKRQFSQEEIDRRGSDLEWLSGIGYRHQQVVAAVARNTAVIPLRAFTFFSNADAVREYLERDEESLLRILEGVRGKEEWTLRFEFDHEKWLDALTGRVPSLKQLSDEAAATTAGKQYLLKKKIDEEKKKAARTAEEDLLLEAERTVRERVAAESILESRDDRSGSFPQINLLIERSRAGDLRGVHEELARRYEPDGVKLVLSGPWPPYSFAKESAGG